MDLQKEHEAFEKWASEETGLYLKKNDRGGFESLPTFMAFEAWQAAKIQAEKALLEQFEINNKLVEQIEKLKADVPGQITITHERFQELITIAVKTVLEAKE